MISSGFHGSAVKMMLAAVCIKNFRSHARRCGLLKLNSLLYWDPVCLKNIISTSAFPIYYPLHTVPRLQNPVPCESKPLPERDSLVPLSNCVVVHESCLCEEEKKTDSSLINYVVVMESRELWKPDLSYDDLLLRNELKSVLSRSCFHYNVNVVSHRAIEHLLTSAAQGSLIMSGKSYYDLDCSSSKSPLLLNSDAKPQDGLKKQDSNLRTGLPSEEQLLNVINRLCHSLLNFFKQTHDLSMYHKSIVFQNNIGGITTRGLSSYAQQMYMLRVYGRIQYAQVKVEIIKITHHIEDGTIRVRWRVSGATRRRVLALLWKYKDSTWKKIVQEEPEWLDGFSVFSVGQDGLIYKHVCDKMMPDEERLNSKHNSLRSRLLKLLGLPHQPATVSGLSAMLAISPLGQNDDIVSPSPKTK